MAAHVNTQLDELERRIDEFHQTYDPLLKSVCTAANNGKWTIQCEEGGMGGCSTMRDIDFTKLLMLIPNAVSLSAKHAGMDKEYDVPRKTLAMEMMAGQKWGRVYGQENYLEYVENTLLPYVEGKAETVALKHTGKTFEELPKPDQDIILAYRALNQIAEEWNKHNYLKTLLTDLSDAHVKHAETIEHKASGAAHLHQLLKQIPRQESNLLGGL